MIDLHPFTKIAWKGQDIRDQWNNRINRISRLHHEAEYRMVLDGYRKCATLHIDNYNLEDRIERIMNDGLVWLPIARSKKYSGFSHKHLYTKKGNPESFVYGVLSRDIEDARLFREVSKRRTDHNKIGELLGYPSCCTKFFTEVWSKDIFDPLYESAINTKNAKVLGDSVIVDDYSEYCNQYLRYFGLRITTHLPCNLKCSRSIEIGEVWLKLMHEIDYTATEWLIQILKLPIEWSILKGIAKINTPLFVGVCNTVFTAREKKVILNGLS